MSMQRQPGILGLWEAPFPNGDPLPPGDALDPLAGGPIAGAQAATGPVGLATPDPLNPGAGVLAGLAVIGAGSGMYSGLGEGEDGDEASEPEAPTLPDRHRHMEFMGATIKVRANPSWNDQARALADAPEPSEDAIEAFFGVVQERHPDMQIEIAETVGPYLRALGKDDLAARLEDLVREMAPHWGA